MKRRILAFLLVFCMVLTYLPATVGAAGTNMASGNLNSANPTKEQIQAKWKEVTSAATVYDETPSVVSPYSAGVLSDSFLQSGLTYLNYVRYVANLPAVQLTDEMNEAAQYGAVVMAAGDDFSHYPHQPEGMDDTFYNKGVAATSSSNISWNWGYNPLLSLQVAVQGCMDDSSSVSNLSCLGHRRWLLNPRLLNVGFGFAQSTTGGNFTDTKVFDTSGAAIDYNFVAWPASGNFPTNIFGTDAPWSITLNPSKYKTPSLSNVVVTLTRESDGKKWGFNSSTGSPSTTAAYMTVENSGYGVSNCIIFRPATAELSSYDGIYTVDVSGIYTTGGAETTLHYQVDFFDVSTYSSHTHSYTATVTAPTCTADGYTTYTCSCGDSYTDDTTAALGHNYTSEVTKEATETEDGVRTYTCSRCNDTYTENIPALGSDVPSSACGDNLTWTLTEDGTLTISGSGAMYDYTETTAPWYEQNGSIKAVVIENGVTGIGKYAFANCTALTEITFEGSAPAFGENCFYGVTATAYYPANDATWTENVRESYGGSITWVSYGDEDESDDLTFSTFAELKQIASVTPGERTVATYVGEGPLTLEENITIPDDLTVYMPEDELIVPAGVQLVTSDAGKLYAGSLTIGGSVTNDGEIYVSDALTVSGTLTLTGDLYMAGGVDASVTSTGSITYVNYAAIIWMCGFENDADLKAVSTAASKASDSHWIYLVYPESSTASLNTSVSLPVNCVLLVDKVLKMTIADGSALTLDCNAIISSALEIDGDLIVGENGYLTLYAPLSVDGVLENHGAIDLYYDDGATLRVSNGANYINVDGGYYSIIFLNSDADTIPSDALSGMDLKDFQIVEYDDEYGHYWSLFNYNYTPTGHTHSYTAGNTVAPTCTLGGYTVYTCSCGDSYQADFTDPTGHSYEVSRIVAPTCSEGGYTVYTCTGCGDSYNADNTAPTGLHVYTDDLDPNCNTCGAIREIKETPTVTETTPMYRLYNPYSGEHFYTGSVEEREMLITAGWNYEGIAWNAPIKSGDPVYRLYNPNSGDHHYTMSAEEKDMLVSVGWKYEGVAWNSASADNIPLYRLYNPNADCGSHHYTGSTEERDYLASLGWVYEGIGWFGMLK